MDLGPGYKTEREEEEYDTIKKKKEAEFTAGKFDFQKEIEPVREIIKEIKIKSRQTMPKMVEEEIEPLKMIKPEVIGGLFERVRFIRERIKEIKSSMKVREQLHDGMMQEIDEDIQEKVTMVGRAMDLDEARNVKMDISVLRKEKRTESIRFWKDLMELTSELRELTESYEIESKIASLFGREEPEEETDADFVDMEKGEPDDVQG